MKKLQNLIDINRKREKETYGKMFDGKNSISDYVSKKTYHDPISYKTVEDREFEKEKQKIDDKV